MKSCSSWVASLWVLFALMPVAGAKTLTPIQIRAKDAGCFECHDKTATHYKFSNGEILSNKVDDAKYYKTDIHAKKIPCDDCHQKYTKDFHPQIEGFKSIKEYRLNRYDVCESCHEKEYKAHADSIHAKLIKEGNQKPPTCTDCHSVHAMESLTHLRSQVLETCRKCHEEIYKKYKKSVHGKAVGQDGKDPAVCSDCHGAHGVQRGKNTKGATGHRQIAATCGKCHEKIQAEFFSSAHYDGVVRGAKNSPTCTDCHGEHGIRKVAKDAGGHAKGVIQTCGKCHERVKNKFFKSIHGKAVKAGDPMAPTCQECHGAHAVRSKVDPTSTISPRNIPRLCGSCHQEGAEVARTHDIHADHILENYSQSIHGEALFKKGLVVTAVCSSCHETHQILPHTDPRSSISAGRIARTCTKCHAQIREVHRKVISGELWENEPHKIPVCVDCHSPHKIRKVFYTEGMANQDCMSCHAKEDLIPDDPAKSARLLVDMTEVEKSEHGKVACVQCHTGGTTSSVRPCETMTQKVDCSICHSKVVEEYKGSTHGELAAEGSSDAPLCADCHGTHGVLGKANPESPIFSRNVPTLCGTCHRTGEKAAVRLHSSEKDILENYEESIHGKGLLESGLTVTATCASCHTAHGERPASDPNSTVSKEKVAETCGQCHSGIYDKFQKSIHSPIFSDVVEDLPTCSDCHSAHKIQRTDRTGFRLHIMDQCGDCHEEVTETYFETYHGKVSKLGYTKVAKCYDCHGAHNILPASHKDSMLHESKIIGTCATCHPSANRGFTGFLTHASHNDFGKYPFLFIAFWGMTLLLIGTLTAAGIHTAIWLRRALKVHKETKASHVAESGKYVRRFDPFYSKLHVMVITSFLTLALTGMMLKFSEMAWARGLAWLFGGFENAGLIHRLAAVVTFAYFALHLWDLLARKRKEEGGLKKVLLGPNSMIPNMTDFWEVVGSIRWFIGKGPRPKYGRWTYWEKFDYFAVFWGVGIIGSTGLLLWFPEFFTILLPGWTLNIATIIHSDEALLAVAFIFTIHFFNTHFRPEKFPMDPVIFTGAVPLEEFKLERPREYEDLVAAGKLDDAMMAPPDPHKVKIWKIFGFSALGTGVLLVLLIFYSLIFG